MEKIILGIDIGGTNTKYGFITQTGKIISSHIIPTDTSVHFEVYTQKLVDDVMKSFKIHNDQYELMAVGVGAPNGNGKTGYIENPPNLAWDLVNLKGIFQDNFKLPVTIENDANVAAVGEKKFGAAQDFENFIVITLGTGLGVGTYINGELYLGSHGVGSEAGHMTIIPDGRACSCGGQGHLEAYVSCTGMKKSVNNELSLKLSFRDISKKYNAGDSDISKVINQSAEQLAIGLASMNALLAPQAFILCGGGTSLGEQFLKQVRSSFDMLVYPPFKGNSSIVMSTISNEYGAILGAASLAL